MKDWQDIFLNTTHENGTGNAICEKHMSSEYHCRSRNVLKPGGKPRLCHEDRSTYQNGEEHGPTTNGVL